ncbi:hypothetical protein BC830DRAFT_1168534 [Chytriomyces sp. MP71]|nr:hypothetical protein BC830DRAFT_1168534 [Chytriomyces sp. MP71]
MELQMIKAQRASEAKEARFLRTLSKKDNQIVSLIMQVSELSSQLTAAMQWLFQDAPGEHRSHKNAGRDPVPTPITNPTHVRSLQPQQLPPAVQSLYVLPVTPVRPEPRPPPLPQPHQPRVHQQQLQPQPAPAKNKPWGKQPRMSYTVALVANKAAIADWIIGICNGDVAPQLQHEPVTYKSLYVNSYFVIHGAFCANPYSDLKQYLYGKGVLQTI